MQPRTCPTFYLKAGVKAPPVPLLDQKWGKMGNGSKRLVNSCAAKVINPKTSNTFCR